MTIIVKCGDRTISTNLEAVKNLLYANGYNIFSRECVYVPVGLFDKIDLMVTPP